MFSNLAQVTQTSEYKAEMRIQTTVYCSQSLDTMYTHTNTHTFTHILIELEREKEAVTRTSPGGQQGGRDGERNHKMSRTQQRGDIFQKEEES